MDILAREGAEGAFLKTDGKTKFEHAPEASTQSFSEALAAARRLYDLRMTTAVVINAYKNLENTPS